MTCSCICINTFLSKIISNIQQRFQYFHRLDLKVSIFGLFLDADYFSLIRTWSGLSSALLYLFPEEPEKKSSFTFF